VLELGDWGRGGALEMKREGLFLGEEEKGSSLIVTEEATSQELLFFLFSLRVLL
jgi:hypothetical protein